MTQLILDGLAQRDQALNLLERTRGEWVERARIVAENICRVKGWVTVDDLREVWPVPPDWDARVVGTVFRDKRFIKAGYQPTLRASSHSRPIAVFRLSGGEVRNERRTAS